MVSVVPQTSDTTNGKLPTAGEQSQQGDTNGVPYKPAVSLAILREVRTAQGAHGLKLRGDFLNYRRYCTRRLARVRRVTTNTNGRGRYIATPITATSVQKDERSLLVPLYLCERAWAHAMDVKRGPTTAGPARARRTVLAKLVKAVSHASELRTLCVTVGADSDTCLEAEAYARWMSATLALEREEWRAALSDFERAHVVYGGLAGVRAGTAGAGVFEERVDEIGQAIRFCKYNLSRDGGADMTDDTDLHGMMREIGAADDVLAEKIEGALAAARKRAAQSFGEVTWCGRKVPLRAEAVREAVLAAEQESAGLGQRGGAKDVDDYDTLFIAYHDASRVVQREIGQFRSETSVRAEARIEELELLAAYLTYGRLTYTMERNKLLVVAFCRKRNTRPDDLARLYDNLVQNANDVLALRGVADDAQVASKAEAQRNLYRAYYCVQLARCYVAADMHAAAERLFERAVARAQSLLHYPELKLEATQVMRDAAGLRVRARAQLYLREARVAQQMGELSVDAAAPHGKRAMCDNLDEFVSYAKHAGTLRRIAQCPPALEAVPCKPVLFDLALDGVRFPGDDEKDAKAGQQNELKQVQSDTTAASSTFVSVQNTRLGRWWSGKG